MLKLDREAFKKGMERLGIDFSEQIKEMENLKSKYEREVEAYV